MYGLEAINAHNGWAMALTGAIIVMTGLTVLSAIISQLHRITDLLEKRGNKKAPAPEEPAFVTSIQPDPANLSDLSTAVERYHLMTMDAGETFDLASLHQIFIQNDDPHPHLTIRSLREQGFLISAGEGRFTWKRQ